MPRPGTMLVILGASAIIGCQSRAKDTGRTPAATGQPVATSGAADTSAPAAATQGNRAAAVPAGPADPEAMKALDRMGAYLRTLTAFQVRADTTRDEVLDDGQRIQFGGRVDLMVQRPARLRAEVTSDRQQRFYFYDGKTFTLWAHRMNYYATVPAPASLGELSDALQQKYGLELPLADLFTWGQAGQDNAAVRTAADIGPSQIDGVSCEHFAFRQADVDWQVWIQQGAYPLPRKIVITTMDDAARPQYSSVLNWNLAPAFNDAAFTFRPPADAHKIVFEELPTRTSER